jgi:hypothetical protein
MQCGCCTFDITFIFQEKIEEEQGPKPKPAMVARSMPFKKPLDWECGSSGRMPAFLPWGRGWGSFGES